VGRRFAILIILVLAGSGAAAAAQATTSVAGSGGTAIQAKAKKCHSTKKHHCKKKKKKVAAPGRALRLNSAKLGPDGNGIDVSVTVSNVGYEDALLAYASNVPCARDYPTAKQQAFDQRSQLTDQLITGFGPVSGTFDVTSNLRFGGFQTVCGVLYDGNQGKAPNKVYATAQRTITPG
jgi:hypothetical protein